MGRGGFWPAISNRFIGTRCRIHIAKWPLVQTDCSKPVRPCLLHPSLSLSLLFSSFLFFPSPSRLWRYQSGKRGVFLAADDVFFATKGRKKEKKMKKEKEGRIENRKFSLRFTFSKKKSNYNESAKLKEKEKGENLNFWYVSTTRTIIITAKLYP